MDKQKFDALTRAFATGTSRRTAIKGIFGGAAAVAVASTRVGAQVDECSPGTVLEDCPIADECSSSTCEPVGVEGAYICVYSGGCGDSLCCPGGNCQECCDSSDCGACDVCDSGTCIEACSACEICTDTGCVPRTGGLCCDGVWVEDGQCCSTSDCTDPAATFCSSVACIDNLCTVIPECPVNQFCCGYGAEGAYCAECCDDDDCLGCATCNDGFCSDPECCTDVDCPPCSFCQAGTCYGECSQSQECCNDECVPFDTCCQGIGDYCGLLAPADGSPQYDCCDGLVCCDIGDDMVCAECCADYDCPKGAYCRGGWCEWPDYCDNDKECPKGTCCCKDGSCSGKCCHHPHPPKPPKPPKPAPDAPVTTLPATGAGESSDSAGLFGAAALGAAAALYAAKKMRETPGTQE